MAAGAKRNICARMKIMVMVKSSNKVSSTQDKILSTTFGINCKNSGEHNGGVSIKNLSCFE